MFQTLILVPVIMVCATIGTIGLIMLIKKFALGSCQIKNSFTKK